MVKNYTKQLIGQVSVNYNNDSSLDEYRQWVKHYISLYKYVTHLYVCRPISRKQTCSDTTLHSSLFIHNYSSSHTVLFINITICTKYKLPFVSLSSQNHRLNINLYKTMPLDAKPSLFIWWMQCYIYRYRYY